MMLRSYGVTDHAQHLPLTQTATSSYAENSDEPQTALEYPLWTMVYKNDAAATTETGKALGDPQSISAAI